MKFLITLYPWENPRLYASNLELKAGDKVIVTADNSNELGIVDRLIADSSETPEGKILREATERDKKVYSGYQGQKKDLLKLARNLAKKFELQMKFVDAMIGLDGKQIIFVFTSDGRVDFRELVKEISREAKKSVRMQQIGSRDEARRLGGFGMCGKELCCVRFKGNMQSITTEMARVQQVAHRGSERISGLCGRLMCCLAYEAEQYKDLLQGMPELYSNVSVKEGKGTVIEINAITQDIKVKLENGDYIIVKKEDLK